MPETATGKRQEEGTGKWRRSFTKQFHVSFYSNSLVSRMKWKSEYYCSLYTKIRRFRKKILFLRFSKCFNIYPG